MGKTESKYFYEEFPSDPEFKEAKRLFDEHGVEEAQDLIRKELEGWQNVEIRIGVTGNSGVGKSTFINAFRGIGDEHEDAAVTDVVEVVCEESPKAYLYPGNPNITLMDLPGIGTPTYPDLDIYCEKVDLESYDTFLILTASRFTQHEFKLAEKIKSMEKSYFLVRTKIDIDDMNEKSRKKKHNTEEMLKKIRKYCQKGVEGLGILENDIFLISNFHPSTWDFPRMVDAILSKLSVHQKEALTLSLRIKYKKSVERKVEILKGKTWLVTLLFIPALPLDLVSANFFSHLINCAEIKRRMKEYRYQLRLPEEDSDAFERMNERLQDEMKEFYTKEDGNFWNKYFGCITSMPILSTVQKARQTNLCLHRILDDMQEMAFKILDDAAATDTDEPMEQ